MNTYGTQEYTFNMRIQLKHKIANETQDNSKIQAGFVTWKINQREKQTPNEEQGCCLFIY